LHVAETAWYDTGRWSQWVDQLARVVEVQGDWPHAGSVVVWESGPAGRGRVRERVAAYEPLAGQETDVEDDSIVGRQSVAFEPLGDRVEVRLALEYRLRRRSPVSGLVDLLFIRRLMGASLAKTLTQFRAAFRASNEASFK
jgi:hypothetical protein